MATRAGTSGDHPTTRPSPTVAVIIPSFRVSAQIVEVVSAIGPEVSLIYVVDDACPEGSGDRVEAEVRDERVRVIRHRTNQGVGAATMTGMEQACRDGATILVKLDGDGQMDPADIGSLIHPICTGQADYTKGNRFYDTERLQPMPLLRLLGNTGLTFLTKFSSGYWQIFDPTNGYIAIHRRVFLLLPLRKISPRYFFESDLLFRLNVIHAVVRDVPMPARYGGEPSGLRPLKALFEFGVGNLRNLVKRIFYNHFLRNFSFGSLELVLGILSVAFGSIAGLAAWLQSISTGVEASAGTVMLAALPIIVGIQLLLSFLAYDIESTPRTPLHPMLRDLDDDP